MRVLPAGAGGNLAIFCIFSGMVLSVAACSGRGPRILDVYPPEGATGVALDDIVEVRFSEPLRGELAPDALRLFTGGERVEALLSLSEDRRSILLQPKTLLLASTTYTARISGTFTNDEGHTASAERSWKFTTVEGCDIEPAEEGQLSAGPDGKGGFIIPGGRRITPPGAQVDLESLPTNAILLQQKRVLVVTNNGYGIDSEKSQSLMVFDVSTPMQPRLLQTIRYPKPKALFYGLAATEDETRLYAAGGESNVVEVYDVQADGTLSLVDNWQVDGFPAGLLLDEARGVLFVAAQTSGELVALDSTTGSTIYRKKVGLLPYDMQMGPMGQKLYLSLWGRADLYQPGQVAVIDPTNGVVTKKIDVGKNPEQMVLLTDGRLLVACSDADRVDVIDTTTDAVVASWPVRNEGEPVGLSPVALAADEAAGRLYVACAQKNSLEVLELSSGHRIGSIPAGWYPTAVRLSGGGEYIYLVNGKGVGSGPITEPVNNETLMHGTLSVFEAPDERRLEAFTEQVRNNNLYPMKFFPDRCLDRGFPLPRALGQPSPIKHVVFILRENKTYDQVLGDLEGTNADPRYVMFGEKYTPNIHRLARQFCNLDNFHVEVEVSVQGHYFAVAATLNDYAEKVWHSNYRDDGRLPALGVHQPDYPAGLFIWHKLEETGIEFRNYGEPYGLLGELDRFEKYMHRDFALDLARHMYLQPDSQRAEYFFAELDEGIFPPFVYILLPNDHTYGRKPGYPTPEWLVAENDYATGLIVEKISHSPFWPETLIIITEDDPQSGMDHVDMHRSLAVLVSPWVKRNHTSSTHYSFASLIKTYELILGMTPLGMLDASAAPVYDCFTSKPDFTPYEAADLQIEYQENNLRMAGARESMGLDFSRPDRAAGLGKILWMAMRPGEPVPEPLLKQAEREEELFGEQGEEINVLPVPLPARKPRP